MRLAETIAKIDGWEFVLLPKPMPKYPLYQFNSSGVQYLPAGQPEYVKVNASVSHTLDVIDKLRRDEALDNATSVNIQQVEEYLKSEEGLNVLHAKIGENLTEGTSWFIEDLSIFLSFCAGRWKRPHNTVVDMVSSIECTEMNPELNYRVKINCNRSKKNLTVLFKYTFESERTPLMGFELERMLIDREIKVEVNLTPYNEEGRYDFSFMYGDWLMSHNHLEQPTQLYSESNTERVNDIIHHSKVVAIRYRDDGTVLFRHIGEHKYNENGRAIFIVHREDGTVIFRNEGYFENGKNHGQGIKAVYDGNGKIFEQYKGEFENGQFHGQGIKTQYYYNGKIFKQYKGEFENDVGHGMGILTVYRDDGTVRGQHEGELENGQFHGQGIWSLYRDDGTTIMKQYKGEFENDQAHGMGILTVYRDDGITVKQQYEGLCGEGIC